MEETTKYKILLTIRYAGDAFFYPFFALFLVTTGLAEARIGFVLSISPVIAIIANPLYAHFCKNARATRNALKVITVIEALIIMAIAFSQNFYLISGLALLLAISGSCHYGLLDSLTTVYAAEHALSYSSIRIYGSFAYAVATFGGGFLIDFLGYQWCFGIASALFILSGVLYQWLKPIDFTKEKQVRKISYRELFKNRAFMLFAVFYILYITINSTTDNFFSTYLASRGLPASGYGFVYCYFVITEVVTLLILNRQKRHLNENYLYLLAAGSLVIRFVANYCYWPLAIVILLSAFRGIGFAIILHLSFVTIVKLVGEQAATFAIMFTILIRSILLALFNNLNGYLIEHFSYQAFYLLAIIIASLMVVFLLLNIWYHQRKKKVNIN